MYENIFYKDWGDKPTFDFNPKLHFEIGENANSMNFETATKLSGSRFVILKGQLSKLERAIANFMIDKHTSINISDAMKISASAMSDRKSVV